MEWISVKDRLPKEYNSDVINSNHVLIYVPRLNEVFKACIFYLDQEEWCVDDMLLSLNFNEVSHWMPLPDKPNEDKKYYHDESKHKNGICFCWEINAADLELPKGSRGEILTRIPKDKE